ncbi:MAG: ATP cone domain-containing protein [Thermoleophilia bacterium]
MAVTKTRQADGGVIERSRRCSKCGRTFSTYERFTDRALHVRKSDGTVVPFGRNRVRRSIEKAVVRPYREEQLERLVRRVVARAHAEAKNGVIDSVALGDIVLGELRVLDPASHIRFALVHLGRLDRGGKGGGWSEIAQVRRWLSKEYPHLMHRPIPGRLATVVKRNGRREPYDRTKLERSIGYAAKGREPADALRRRSEQVADIVEGSLHDQPMVTSGQIAAAILGVFREWDHIAFLRFASTAKLFDSPEDFEAEAGTLLLQKQRPPE